MRFAGAALAMVMAFVPTMASSTIMSASISGDWNDHPFWNSWSIELRYDTDRLVNIGGGVYQGSDALISAAGYFEGYCHEQWIGLCDPQIDVPRTVQFNETSFSFFQVSIEDWFEPNFDVMRFSFASANAAATMGLFIPEGATIETSVNYDGEGEYGNAEVGDESIPDIHAHRISITRAPIPEPTTWALMIAGFGLAGVTLRRRAVLI